MANYQWAEMEQNGRILVRASAKFIDRDLVETGEINAKL